MKRYIVALVGMVVSMSSCSDFLTENSQNKSYIESYSDVDELLIGSGYMKYQDNEGYYPYVHLMADEVQQNKTLLLNIDPLNAANKYFGYYTWQGNVDLSFDKLSSSSDNYTFNKLYEHINICNMALYEIDKQSGNTTAEREAITRIKGEAHFLRAAYYFVLLNLYGKPYQASSSTDLGVPIKLTEMIEDVKFSRNTVAEVYAQVLADLSQAESFLEDVAHKSIYRADINAVNLLQSRVCLYMSDYENAQAYANKVIGRKNTLTDLNSFSGNIFLTETSDELIFTMGKYANFQELISWNYKGFGVNEVYYNAIPDDDLRKSIFFNIFRETTWKEDPVTGDWVEIVVASIPMCKKFFDAQGDYVDVNVSDNFSMRVSEAYLNLAEAAACQGENAVAQGAINTLLQNRISSGSYTPVTAEGEELVTLIREQRRLELYNEGHRWFDLRRYAVATQYPQVATLKNSYTVFGIDESLSPIATYEYTLKMDDAANTLPVPYQIAQFNNMANNARSERQPSAVINY